MRSDKPAPYSQFYNRFQNKPQELELWELVR